MRFNMKKHTDDTDWIDKHGFSLEVAGLTVKSG
jgi:hypothetical protein